MLDMDSKLLPPWLRPIQARWYDEECPPRQLDVRAWTHTSWPARAAPL